MKGKTSNYLLLALVLVIWGMVIYRVVQALSEPDIPMPTVRGTKKRPKEKVGSHWPDTLVLAYRDPFFGGIISDGQTGSDSMAVGTAVPRPAPVPQEPPWPEVEYLGTISNRQERKEVVLLKLGGRSRMMRPGDEILGVSYLKKTKNGVQLQYLGQRKEIGKSQ